MKRGMGLKESAPFLKIESLFSEAQRLPVQCCANERTTDFYFKVMPKSKVSFSTVGLRSTALK